MRRSLTGSSLSQIKPIRHGCGRLVLPFSPFSYGDWSEFACSVQRLCARRLARHHRGRVVGLAFGKIDTAEMEYAPAWYLPKLFNYQSPPSSKIAPSASWYRESPICTEYKAANKDSGHIESHCLPFCSGKPPPINYGNVSVHRIVDSSSRTWR